MGSFSNLLLTGFSPPKISIRWHRRIPSIRNHQILQKSSLQSTRMTHSRWVWVQVQSQVVMLGEVAICSAADMTLTLKTTYPSKTFLVSFGRFPMSSASQSWHFSRSRLMPKNRCTSKSLHQSMILLRRKRLTWMKKIWMMTSLES